MTDSSDSRFVGWSSRDTQKNRWDQLVLDHNLDNCSVLDVGCGVGDFFWIPSKIFQRFLRWYRYQHDNDQGGC